MARQPRDYLLSTKDNLLKTNSYILIKTIDPAYSGAND